MPVDLAALAAFLVDAKRATYAGQGDDASVEPMLQATRQLEYGAGSWFYRDVYVGFAFFVGQEIVYQRAHPVWSMAYAGGVLDDDVDVDAVYAFLREVLARVEAAAPFRGPDEVEGATYRYENRRDGGVDRFSGSERILGADRRVYELAYVGGLVDR